MEENKIGPPPEARTDLELTSPTETMKKRSNNSSRARPRPRPVPSEQASLIPDSVQEPAQEESQDPPANVAQTLEEEDKTPEDEKLIVDVYSKAEDIVKLSKSLLKLGLAKDYRTRNAVADSISRVVVEKIFPDLHDISDETLKDPLTTQARNVIINGYYAFDDKDDFHLYDSLVLKDGAGRRSHGFRGRGVVMYSNEAFHGIHPNFAPRDSLHERYEARDVDLENFALFGNGIGTYLEGGKFKNGVFVGEGVLTNAHNLTFENVWVITPHGKYFIEKTEEPMERFLLKDEWRRD